MNFASIDTFLANPTGLVIFFLLTVWSLIWKGIALWRAANNQQRNWFVVLLVINSLGILEIIYIFYFSKPKKSKESPREEQ